MSEFLTQNGFFHTRKKLKFLIIVFEYLYNIIIFHITSLISTENNIFFFSFTFERFWALKIFYDLRKYVKNYNITNNYCDE